MGASAPASLRRRDARGSGLLVVLGISVLLGTLGLAYIAFAQVEARRAFRVASAARARHATSDVLHLAAAWFDPSTPSRGPAPEDWERRLRRGDLDDDGVDDAACDGRAEGGRFTAAPSGASGTTAGRADDAAAGARTCGRPGTPDLLLSRDGRGAAYLARLGASSGGGIAIERIAISAPRTVRGQRTGIATIPCTVSVRHRGHVVARAAGSATVAPLPALRGEAVLAAGGDALVAAGATVRWGVIEAAGDVSLPAVDERGFPRSGVPRRLDGRSPMDFAPGRFVDWNLRTGRREWVGSELLGGTVRGRLVGTVMSRPVPLPDPWLAVQAGGNLLLGGAPSCTGSRPTQPFPYEPRLVDLVDDMSHLTCRQRPEDPLQGQRAAASIAAQARAVAAAGRARRFVLVAARAEESHPDEAANGEPLWAEHGVGPARTAAAWLAQTRDDAALAVFLAVGSPRPERVRIGAGAGVVFVEAGEVVVTGEGGARLEPVALPPEPFLDDGIDADGDGFPDPATVGNGAWDADLQSDGTPEQDPTAADAGWAFSVVHGDVLPGWPPDDDLDPARVESVPHEPFLNLRYPDDATDLSVSVDVAAGGDEGSRPAGVGPDGEPTGRTSMARDAVGGRVTLPVVFRGLLVNPVGAVTLATGARVHGAVRAAGTVSVLDGAELTFDAALAAEGWPSGMSLPRVAIKDVVVRRVGAGGEGRDRVRDGVGEEPRETGARDAVPVARASGRSGPPRDGGRSPRR